METTTIEVTDETWTQLNRRKERGETFDDVISDLMTAEVRPVAPEKEPRVVDWEAADDDQECANRVPDRGACDADADYVLTIRNGKNGKETDVPYCEKHANLPEEEVEA